MERGERGTSCTLQKMGIKLTRSLLFVHIIWDFKFTALQNVTKSEGTSYEIHHFLFQNISRDRKIQSLLQKYILQKKGCKKRGGN